MTIIIPCALPYNEVTIVLSHPNELYDLSLFDEKGNLQKEIKNVTGNFLTIPAGDLRRELTTIN